MNNGYGVDETSAQLKREAAAGAGVEQTNASSAAAERERRQQAVQQVKDVSFSS